jgi:hypothetical protein
MQGRKKSGKSPASSVLGASGQNKRTYSKVDMEIRKEDQ